MYFPFEGVDENAEKQKNSEHFLKEKLAFPKRRVVSIKWYSKDT